MTVKKKVIVKNLGAGGPEYGKSKTPSFIFEMIYKLYPKDAVKIDENFYRFSQISFSNSTARQLNREIKMVAACLNIN